MRRVVVTGLGCVSALGRDVTTTWTALCAGRSGIRPYNPALPEAMRFAVGTKVVAQVHDFSPRAHCSDEQLARLDRFAQLALCAGIEAVRDAGLQFDERLGARCAIILGSGIGGLESMDEAFQRLYVRGVQRMPPLTVPKVMINGAVSALSMQFGVTGPCFAVSSACSSANHALAQAFALIRGGLADVALSGGSEACLIPGVLKCWEALRVLAPDTCRPFCRERKGIVLGEGAGILALEALDHARLRGARIYAELAGCGMGADAFDIVQPDARGAARAMAMALDSAGLHPERIGYINAHGTGTPSNDVTETAAIHRVFGAHARRLAVSSTKSMHGHALGAAGGIEAVATVKALAEGVLPPTANFTEADPECDLDYLPNQAREQRVDAALSNSFAFGGLNAVLAFTRMA